MSEDLMLKCLIAFILGWFLSRQMGNGFSVGGRKQFGMVPCLKTDGIVNTMPPYEDCSKRGPKKCKKNDEDSTCTWWNDTCTYTEQQCTGDTVVSPSNPGGKYCKCPSGFEIT